MGDRPMRPGWEQWGPDDRSWRRGGLTADRGADGRWTGRWGLEEATRPTEEHAQAAIERVAWERAAETIQALGGMVLTTEQLRDPLQAYVAVMRATAEGAE